MFVRWTNLTLDADEQRRLPGYRDEAVVRRFDAPEALDMRFYEVRARSVLNRVPGASRMPFRWTINPYRGCTHACAYCMAGDTPILMADGRCKPLADIDVGDAIYGTVRQGSYRRFVVTSVLAKWSSIKSAHRVTLEDETQLIASEDHRFLTARGWKHMVGAERGPLCRPHLTLNSRLMGTGRFANDPAITRKRSIEGQAIKTRSRLGVVSIEALGVDMLMYDITTGTGDFIADGVVSHNCFARPTHTYLGFDAGRDFEREIVVKVNAPEVLRTELARKSWKGEHVALGTNTDPYQWVEGRYRLMVGIWEAMRDAADGRGNPCSVLTKSPLLLRDLPLMLAIAERTRFSASLSIPTLDEKAWRATEPHTPNPRARLEAVAELNRAGIPTGVLIAPLMPGINDAPHQLEPLLQGAIDAGAQSIGGVALHLRGEVRDVFMEWLRTQRPDLVERYAELYRRGAYAPREERERLAGLVRRRAARDRSGPQGDATRRGGAAREQGGRWSGLRPGSTTDANTEPTVPQESLF
jgi:DNA repair photolyase